MKSDHALLQEFRKHRSETAFQELVERHLSLVHSVAQRVTCNSELAKDVSQIVFAKLAQSRPLRSEVNFLAWLHRTTRHAAIDLVRSENRRRKRESTAYETMNNDSTSPLWSQIEPVLDDILVLLSEKDRNLILARYYQGQSHAATAKQLGISEDAARVRTTRALERLRKRFAKKGIQTSAALLGSSLTSYAVTPASSALVAEVCTSVSALPALGAGAVTLAGLKSLLPSIGFLAVAIPLTSAQFRETTRLESEIRSVQSVVRLQSIEEENEVLVKAPSLSLSDENEVSAIRKQSRQFDILVQLFEEQGASALPTEVFTKDLEPTDGLIEILGLSEKVAEELRAFGQETLAQIKEWEGKNVIKDEPVKLQTIGEHTLAQIKEMEENGVRKDRILAFKAQQEAIHALMHDPPPSEYDHAFKIPSADEEMKSVRQGFQTGVRRIVGDETFALIQRKLMSEFLEEERDYLVSFKLRKDAKGRDRASLSLSQLNSAGDVVSSFHGGGGFSLVSESRTLRRFSHLFALVSEQ